ncbi:hypothetical protein CHUAL_007325 [Chamberlinius hualienensis]
MEAVNLLWFITFATVIWQTSSAVTDNFRCSLDLPLCDVTQDNSTWCCPYTDGVCCNNTKACCPKGATCKPDFGLCIPRNKMGLLMIDQLYSPVPLQFQNSKLRIKWEVCPSKKMACPGKSTCCPGPYIGYDCCPLVQGVCCGDFKHCCPFDTTCDIKLGQCVDAYNNTFPWMKKMKANATDYTHVKKVKLFKTYARICPDSETTCERHQTCCSTSNGTYECCTYSDGVCCPGAFCCPPGTTCDNSAAGCLAEKKPFNNFFKRVPNLEFFDETKSLFQQTTNYNLKTLLKSTVQQICPGGRYSCPDFMTCCPVSGGKYGCCPFPNSVCCAQDWHCCPGGYQCDLKDNKCIKGGMFTPVFKKLPATKVVSVKEDCPDKSHCPDNYTCCQIPSLAYGCCPLKSATCCSDKIHCCPHGTVCDIEVGTCKQGSGIGFSPLNQINVTSNFN